MTDLYRIRIPEPERYRNGGWRITTPLGTWLAFPLENGRWWWEAAREYGAHPAPTEAAALDAIREDIRQRLMGILEPVETVEKGSIDEF